MDCLLVRGGLFLLLKSDGDASRFMRFCFKFKDEFELRLFFRLLSVLTLLLNCCVVGCCCV